MRDVLKDYELLLQRGGPVGRAVVTRVWGSAPRPEGACLLATGDGQIAGSVSGGCVETATAEEIAQAIARGTPKLVTYGVSHERAWEVGLACGGTIKVFVEPVVRPEVIAAARSETGSVVATVIDAGSVPRRLGGSAVVREDGTVETGPESRWLRDWVAEPAVAALRREGSETLDVTAPEGASVSVFLEVFPRRPKLVIFGGVHIAMALVPLAKALGFRTTVADGRQPFVTRERFPDADELLVAWPEEAFRQIGLDTATYVCVLSHDPKFDEPALELALHSPARYIGAIGSRKTQAHRRARLLEQGFTPEELTRLHGPIGLDLGGRNPSETALAIMAEITMTRFGGTGRPLMTTSSRSP
jgi:xanthine dehydrogenase accessory factor